MGLEGVASVELKPINAQRVLSTPMLQSTLKLLC
jgi:hypothetical protein